MTMLKPPTLLEHLAALKAQQKAIGTAVLKVEAELIEALERAQQKTVTAGGSLTGTLVRGSTISIDEDALKRALSPAQWKKVTKQVLDKERLEAHIVTGDVDANIVAAASIEKDRKPFIKVSGTLPEPVPVAGPVSSPKKRVRPPSP